MADRISLVTVYDNYEFDPEFRTGFGFSCLVKKDNKNILFDTGGDSETLLFNLKKVGVTPGDTDAAVISHMHGDHTGGLDGILRENKDVKVYMPELPEPIEVIPGIYTTGVLGTWLKEQGLIVETEKGPVLITGCAHPGIVNMVKRAKKVTEQRVYLVLGGFHLGGASDSQLLGIIEAFKKLGVQKVAPCHCSGDRARELFREEFGKDYIDNGVGRKIEI